MRVWMVCLLFGLALGTLLVACGASDSMSDQQGALNRGAPAATPDPYKTRYEAYPYAPAEDQRIIDLGTVVNSMQTTYLTECLMHDQILAGQLAASGWSLQDHAYRNGAETVPYQDGRLDAVVMGDSAAIAASKTADFYLYSTISTGHISVLANQKLLPAQLKGKRVGYSAGTVTHFTVYRALVLGGLAMSDVTSIEVQAPQAQAALEKNQVDVVSVYEPFTSTILHQLPQSAIVSRNNIFTFFCLDRRFADQNPGLVDYLLAAVVRAAVWARSSEANTRTCLVWIRQEQERFVGSSVLGPQEPWISQLRRETVDTPSYPMLPKDLAEPGNLQLQQFEFMKLQGIIAKDADWTSYMARFKPELLSRIILQPDIYQTNRFDYGARQVRPDLATR